MIGPVMDDCRRHDRTMPASAASAPASTLAQCFPCTPTQVRMSAISSSSPMVAPAYDRRRHRIGGQEDRAEWPQVVAGRHRLVVARDKHAVADLVDDDGRRRAPWRTSARNAADGIDYVGNLPAVVASERSGDAGGQRRGHPLQLLAQHRNGGWPLAMPTPATPAGSPTGPQAARQQSPRHGLIFQGGTRAARLDWLRTSSIP